MIVACMTTREGVGSAMGLAVASAGRAGYTGMAAPQPRAKAQIDAMAKNGSFDMRAK